MACGATLKRSHDFDHLLSPTSKASVGHSCPTYCSPPAKKSRRMLPVKPMDQPEMSQDALSLSKLANSTGSPQSPFKNVGKEFSLKSEHVLKNIYDEYKRMKRRRQLAIQSDEQRGTTSASVDISSSQLTQAILSPAARKSDGESPLLSIKQVGLICERLLKEQEEKLTDQYEKILVTKLSEQYDAFVKFNHDQIQRRMSEQPASYVS